MRMKKILGLGLAASAIFLLATCQVKEETPAETVFRSLLKVAASDAADYDSYGLALAVDAGRALVGSPGFDGSGDNQGAAYLYIASQGGEDGWGEVKKLVPDDPADGDLFGISVGLAGDYAVVGAGAADGASVDQGAAYIFYRNQGGEDNWGQFKKLTADDADDGDGFGFAVAIDGDTIIVGSDGADGSGSDQGAAYIFSRDLGGPDNWGQAAKLVSGEPADDNQFGFAVDIDGDYALVGSPGEDGSGIDRGIVYIFSRDLGGSEAWGRIGEFSPTDVPDYTYIGTAVAIDGALAVIGSAFEDNAGTDRGAVHILSRDYGGMDSWGRVKRVVASDEHDNDFFGYAVAIAGDDILVGSAWARGGGTERGQGYLFSRDEGGTDNWGEVQRLRASDAADGDWFGSAVGIDGDYVLVGAPGEDGSGADRGAAYVFKRI
jgi:hypothetical protein